MQLRRLCLQVHSTGGLCNAAGRSISRDLYSGIKRVNPRRSFQSVSKLNESIHQERPGEQYWKPWKNFLVSLCSSIKHLRLRQPLGDWTVDHNNSRRMYPCYWPKQEGCLRRPSISGNDASSIQYSVHTCDTFPYWTYRCSGTTKFLPDDATPIDVVTHSQDGCEGWILRKAPSFRRRPQRHKHRSYAASAISSDTPLIGNNEFFRHLRSQPKHISQYYAEIALSLHPEEQIGRAHV